MNAKPTFARPSLLFTTFAASLATFVAIGLLTGVAFLLQRDGTPLEQIAAAERACIERVYASEREVCIRDWLTAARASNVASK